MPDQQHSLGWPEKRSGGTPRCTGDFFGAWPRAGDLSCLLYDETKKKKFFLMKYFKHSENSRYLCTPKILQMWTMLSHLLRISLFLYICIYIYIFFNSRSFIYLFMTVLSLRFCARAFSSCSKWGPLFITVRGPLTIAASPVVEHRLQMRRPSNCGSRTQLHRGTWDPPRPGLEPVSPALAGRLSTTVPPGKPLSLFFLMSLANGLSILSSQRTSF